MSTSELPSQTLLSDFRLATPTWENTDKHFLRHLWQVAREELAAYFWRFVVYRGNRSAYLRHLGVRVGPDCDILNTPKDFGTEPWLIELGQRVTVTHGVVFLTHDGANRVFRQTVPGSVQWGNRFGTIRVLDNSFIGVNAVIMPDVQIGPDSIVGAGSVVVKDVPPRTVVAGAPARVICTLDEYIEKYKSKMVPIQATDREDLRRELTQRLWGEVR